MTRREWRIGGSSWPHLPGVLSSDTAFLSVKSSGLFSEWPLFITLVLSCGCIISRGH